MSSWSSLRNALVALLAIAGCKSHRAEQQAVTPGPALGSPIPPAAKSGVVPRATGTITIDGDWHEQDWLKNNLRFQLRGDDGDLARPYSEVRFVHDDSMLYIGLYAADLNIVSDDAFDVVIGALNVRMFVTGKMTPESPDIKLAVDMDGTLDDPSNHDEEWKIEAAIPLSKTGLAPGKSVDTHIARCDILKDGSKRCGQWTGQLSLAD